MKNTFRTGSSLLGEIVSATENITYFFEPMHPLKNHLNSAGLTAPVTEIVNNFLTNSMFCKEEALNVILKDKFITNRSRNILSCSSESNVVIKSIRLSAENVKMFLTKNNEATDADFKIIHLFR